MKKWLLLVLVLAAALRFYNLSGYLQFLGDQGRDVLIVKQMVVDHKWTLLGPNASVGGFFTGPIYYYFMLPFLWLFRLDPVGPAYLSAILGVATVGLIYWFGARFFSSRAGLIAAFLVAISPKMVDISRFSWNPNPVPFFTLLTFCFLYLAAVRNKLIFSFLAGAGLGILFQLHYTTLALIPIVGLCALVIFPRKRWVLNLFVGLGGFLLGNSLFLIFEIRHGFPNLISVWEFITRRGQTIAPRSFNFFWLVMEILRRLYGMTLGVKDLLWEYIFLFVSLGSLGFWLRKDGTRIKGAIILCWLIFGALVAGSYKGELYDHYFGHLYPLPFLLLGLTGDYLLKKAWTVPVATAVLGILIYFAIQWTYLRYPPQYMLDQVKEIDKMVLNYTSEKPYNLGLISNYNSDYGYRYYLELWGRSPVAIENPQNDPARATVTSQLVVICEEKKCEPLGNSRWEIAGFGRAEIVDEKTGPAGIRVFRLIHYKG